MRKNKKNIVILSLCLVILFQSFVSFSKDFLPPYRNNKDVTLKVLSWFSEPKDVLKEFKRKYRNIEVEWIQIKYSDYYSKLSESIQDPDKCPDLVFVELPLLNYYANQKQLMNLSKMGADLYYKEMFKEWLWNAAGRIEVVPIIGGPDCYSCAKIPTEPKLQVYGLPYILGPAVLFYDEKFLKKNNLSVPKDWNDFEKISERFSKDSSDKKLLAISNDPSFLIGFSWRNGERVLSYSQQNMNYYFNFDVESLNRLFEEFKSLYSQEALEFLSFDKMLERSSEFIFMIAPHWFARCLNGFKFANVPPLSNRSSKVFDLDTITLSIPRNSTNPVEAFLLAGWLSCSKYSTSYLEKSGLIPSVNYNSLKFKDLNLKTLDGPDMTFLYPDILKKFYDEILNDSISSGKLNRVSKILQEKLRSFFSSNKYLLLLPKGESCE